MRRRTKLVAYSAALAALLTLALTLLTLNLNVPGSVVHRPLDTSAAVGDPLFMRTLGHLLGPPFVAGNSVRALRNGDEFFPAMLTAIRRARHSRLAGPTAVGTAAGALGEAVRIAGVERNGDGSEITSVPISPHPHRICKK